MAPWPERPLRVGQQHQPKQMRTSDLSWQSPKANLSTIQVRLGRRPLYGTMLALVLVLFTFGSRAENELPTQVPKAEETNSLETLRTYLQLQEQIHATQLSIEENRKEANAAAARQTEALAGRLEAIEAALSAGRAQNLDVMQGSNRLMVVVAVSIAALGLLAMVLVAFSHWRTMNRFAEIATGLPAARGGAPFTVAGALGRGTSPVVSVTADESNARLLGAIDRLEQRIHELEHVPEAIAINPAVKNVENGTAPSGNGSVSNEPHSGQIAILLGKGQSLLNLDKPDEALACFEEVLALQPDHAEAFVKKGMALERLRKPDEAIQSYDRAIELDSSITIAYLYKGGLFNRMERFSEAVECYEKALRTQEKQA
jgi:tetratricopeptide (TPR) repeat protein